MSVVYFKLVWQISVCQMQETSPGKFQKCGAVPIEVEASRKDTYKCLLARAMKKCKMVQKRESSFFKLNGTRILDEPLTVNGKEKGWMLGNYLQVVKKSPSSLMLGIANLPAYSKASTVERMTAPHTISLI